MTGSILGRSEPEEAFSATRCAGTRSNGRSPSVMYLHMCTYRHTRTDTDTDTDTDTHIYIHT